MRGNDEIDQIVDALRMVIESRVGGQDDGAGSRQPQHVLEMNRR
jgi:hypothetical protein